MLRFLIGLVLGLFIGVVVVGLGGNAVVRETARQNEAREAILMRSLPPAERQRNVSPRNPVFEMSLPDLLADWWETGVRTASFVMGFGKTSAPDSGPTTSVPPAAGSPAGGGTAGRPKSPVRDITNEPSAR